MTAKLTRLALAISCILLAFAVLMPYVNIASTHNTSEILQKQDNPHASLQQNLAAELPVYSAISEHPLFTPERKATVATNDVIDTFISKESQQTEASTDTPHPPNLLGVMWVNGVKRVFVLGDTDSTVVTLKQGDSYKNWLLTSIANNEVVMTKQGKDVVVTMNGLGKDILQMENDGNELLSFTSPSVVGKQKNTYGSDQTSKDRVNDEFIDHL